MVPKLLLFHYLYNLNKMNFVINYNSVFKICFIKERRNISKICSCGPLSLIFQEIITITIRITTTAIALCWLLSDYVHHNEWRSRNYFCGAKAINIKFMSVCLYPELSSMKCACAVLYSHLWPFWIYYIFATLSHRWHDFREERFDMKCVCFNLSNAELNPICNLLALLAHTILHVSRIRVNFL
jgi:hypothetical protein